MKTLLKTFIPLILKNKIKMSEVETTIARIKKHQGVEGSFITNADKKAFRTNYIGETEKGGKLVNNVLTLTEKAKLLVRDLDPSNDLSFLRIKTKNKEIMVSPDSSFMYIVLQNTSKDRGEEM